MVLFFNEFFSGELQEINKIIETVKYGDKLGMSSFDVGLSLLLDAAERDYNSYMYSYRFV